MKVYEGQELEYHLMGMEYNASLLPSPGWYPCTVSWLHTNGDVEISFTSPELEGVGCTVLRKNITSAFREKQRER